MQSLVLDLREAYFLSGRILNGTLQIPRRKKRQVFKPLNAKLKNLIKLVTSVIPLHPDYYFDIEQQDPSVHVTFENFSHVFHSSVLQGKLSKYSMCDNADEKTLSLISNICEEIYDMYGDLCKIYPYIA